MEKIAVPSVEEVKEMSFFIRRLTRCYLSSLTPFEMDENMNLVLVLLKCIDEEELDIKDVIFLYHQKRKGNPVASLIISECHLYGTSPFDFDIRKSELLFRSSSTKIVQKSKKLISKSSLFVLALRSIRWNRKNDAVLYFLEFLSKEKGRRTEFLAKELFRKRYITKKEYVLFLLEFIEAGRNDLILEFSSLVMKDKRFSFFYFVTERLLSASKRIEERKALSILLLMQGRKEESDMMLEELSDTDSFSRARLLLKRGGKEDLRRLEIASEEREYLDFNLSIVLHRKGYYRKGQYHFLKAIEEKDKRALELSIRTGLFRKTSLSVMKTMIAKKQGRKINSLLCLLNDKEKRSLELVREQTLH